MNPQIALVVDVQNHVFSSGFGKTRLHDFDCVIARRKLRENETAVAVRGVVRSKAFAVSVIVTLAPDTTAFCSSTTVPLKVAVADCARIVAVNKASIKNNPNINDEKFCIVNFFPQNVKFKSVL